MAGRQCEGMESHDSLTDSEVKIEIDVAEDESLLWSTEDDTQGNSFFYRQLMCTTRLTQSRYTDTRLTSISPYPMMPD